MSKNYQKTQKKNTAERLLWQPKCENIETHAAKYTAFSKRIHSDIHELFKK